ncbi:hypothetical protein RDI58_029035 [Solanum bulbocastanum]|uniref:Uncharacterized protein n=1 Tax=Solanum bulbocastanum TaxID=147425 RepID=A0AAN8STN6_SOLBU
MGRWSNASFENVERGVIA